MRVLFVSGELIAGDLALRLQAEGCDVRLYIEHPRQKSCLDGFVPKTEDWKAELDWVGKDGLIVFDDVGYGADQDALYKDGYRVVGGSAGGDRLELDRTYAQEVFAKCGMTVEPTFTFECPIEASKYVQELGGAWVVKQNDHQSHLNYVGVMDDGSDACGILTSYAKLGIRNVSVQRRLEGIEVAVARYFNGNDWVGPIEISFEHKGLMNQEIGPKTGEMGTLMWFVDHCRLFDETLGLMKDHLREAGFRGDFDINCFVNGDAVWPIEATARFGCPATHLHSALFLTPWRELLSAIADGTQCDLQVRNDFCIGLTLAVPPFPYDGEQLANVSAEGIPFFLKRALSSEEWQNFHPEGMAKTFDEKGEQIFLTRSLGYTAFVTGIGPSVPEAQAAAYALANQVVIPKVMFRTDIGNRFLDGQEKELKKYGWII